jgi:shikimate kinase
MRERTKKKKKKLKRDFEHQRLKLRFATQQDRCDRQHQKACQAFYLAEQLENERTFLENQLLHHGQPQVIAQGGKVVCRKNNNKQTRSRQKNRVFFVYHKLKLRRFLRRSLAHS